MNDSEKINVLWPWFHGNGNKGAGKRLQSLEDSVHGKEDCSTMKEVHKHLEWHEKMSGRRWGLYVGFTIVVITQVLATIFLGGN